jgi:hypothetical protein
MRFIAATFAVLAAGRSEVPLAAMLVGARDQLCGAIGSGRGCDGRCRAGRGLGCRLRDHRRAGEHSVLQIAVDARLVMARALRVGFTTQEIVRTGQ